MPIVCPPVGGAMGNATVPNDAPIQPPQAFVDNVAKRLSPVNYDLESLDFSGMTGSSLTQGNNDVGTLRAAGWTVTTN